MPLEQSPQLSAERGVPRPGAGQGRGEQQKADQRQQDGQQQHCPCWLGLISTDRVRVGGAWSCLYQALGLASGMGLAAGCRGGSILEVSLLAGDTADVSIHNLVCNLGFCAGLALHRSLAVHTLTAQIHTGHPWLTAALGFPITGARGNLLEAQHGVTGAAQLAEGEVVPVLIVGIVGASLTRCVLAVAAYGRDKLAWGTAGAADLMLGLVVFLVLVPARLVFYAIWGHRLGLRRRQDTAESQQKWPPGQAAGRGPRQAHGGLLGRLTRPGGGLRGKWEARTS